MTLTKTARNDFFSDAMKGDRHVVRDLLPERYILRYHHDSSNRLRGVLVVVTDGPRFQVGFSLCKLSMDKFDRRRGVAIAMSRLNSGRYDGDFAGQFDIQGIVDNLPETMQLGASRLLTRLRDNHLNPKA